MDFSKILGPFLCKPTESRIAFWFSAGAENIQSIEVKIGGLAAPIKIEKIQDEPSFNAWLGVSPSTLSPNTVYHYEVFIDGKAFLPPGVIKEDLWFKTLSDNPTDPVDFILMSCNGIEEYAHKKTPEMSDTWNMWEWLDRELKNHPNCRVGVLGGDQVYMDDTFKENLAAYNPGDTKQAMAGFQSAYLKYWEHPAYRRIMARIPCVLMWDDHDIIDGYGSREEALKDPIKWKTYYALAKSAFEQMQASRNPEALDPSSSFTFFWRLGSRMFVGLDLRSNRQIISNTESSMISENQRNQMEMAFSMIDKSTEQLFIVSPVTIARMGGEIESILGNFANFLWSLGSKISYGKPKARSAFWTVVFGLLYWVLHFNTPSFPAVAQSVCLLALSIFLLANLGNFSRYFAKGKGAVKWIFISFTGISVLLCGWAVWRGSQIVERSIWDALLSSLSRASGAAIGNMYEGLVIALLSILLFNFSTLPKNDIQKLILKAVGSFGLLLFALFNLWLGLPGKEIVMGSLLSQWLLLVFVIITYLLSVLEGLGQVDMVAGLDDDIRDGWSSHANKKDLDWLSRQILKISDRGIKQIFVLCGDIHTGGLSTIELKTNESKTRLFQITSSPMSYVTMPPIVEKLTSGNKAIELKPSDDLTVRCTNVFFRSYRNFAIIKTERDRCDAVFFFEDLGSPLSIDLSRNP